MRKRNGPDCDYDKQNISVKTNLTPPLFIAVPVPSQERGRSYISVLVISIFPTARHILFLLFSSYSLLREFIFFTNFDYAQNLIKINVKQNLRGNQQWVI